MTYEFTKNVTVEGKAYSEGDTVGGEEIPQGSLVSLVRLKWLVPVKATPIDIQELAAATPKKARK